MSCDEIILRQLEIIPVFMPERNPARAAEELSLSNISVHKAIHSLEKRVCSREHARFQRADRPA